MINILFILTAFYYVFLALFLYLAIIVQKGIRKIYLYTIIIIIYGCIVQQLAIQLLPYYERPLFLDEVVWIIEPIMGFRLMINDELVLFRLFRDLTGLHLSMLTLHAGFFGFVLRYVIFLVIVLLAVIGLQKRFKLNIWLLWVSSLLIDLWTTLVNGSGAHDYILFYVPPVAVTGDIKDIVVQTMVIAIVVSRFMNEFKKSLHLTDDS